MRQFISIFALTLLSITSSYAGTWYIGGGYGRGHASVDSSDFAGNPTVSRWQGGGKGFIGYQFNDNLAAQFTYIFFGNININRQGKIHPRTLEGSLVGILPIDKLISLGAAAGLANTHYRIDSGVTYSGGIDRSPKNGFGFGYTLFAQYLIEQNAYVRLAWDQVLSRGNSTRVKPNQSLISLNLVLNLGDTYSNTYTS